MLARIIKIKYIYPKYQIAVHGIYIYNSQNYAFLCVMGDFIDDFFSFGNFRLVTHSSELKLSNN